MVMVRGDKKAINELISQKQPLRAGLSGCFSHEDEVFWLGLMR
jgi:hypothetical protein